MPTQLAALPSDKAIKLQLAWGAAKLADPGRHQHRQCAAPGCEGRWELRDERQWCSKHATVCHAKGCQERVSACPPLVDMFGKPLPTERITVLKAAYPELCPEHQSVAVAV